MNSVNNFIGRFIYSAYLILCCSPLFAQCDFSVSETSPCGGTEVEFSTVSNAPGFAWDFDNNGIYDAFGNTVNYTFPAVSTDQNYTIILALDSVMCNTDTLLVLGVPDASIGVIPGTGTMNGNEIRVCSGAAQATLSIFNTLYFSQNWAM